MSEPDFRSDAIFHAERRGGVEGFAGTGLSRGPWHADTQHGGPMLGLLARAIERHPSRAPMQVTRLTVDIMRAAPTEWVETRCRAVRTGKNVEVLEAALVADGHEYARATAMRFRVSEVEVDPPADLEFPALPEPNRVSFFGTRPREAFHLATEMRPALGHELPALWLRLRVPLVAGEETTPLQLVAAASDTTYSISFIARMVKNPQSLTNRRVVPINPDTTVNVHRPLEGEWVGLQGWCHQDPSGAGTAFAHLFDLRGSIGHASQSILIRGPEARPEAWRELDEQMQKR